MEDTLYASQRELYFDTYSAKIQSENTTEDAINLLQLLDISYFYAMDRHVWLYTVEGRKVIVNSTLKQVVKELEQFGFEYVTRSFVVNRLNVTAHYPDNHNAEKVDPLVGTGGHLLVKCSGQSERAYRTGQHHVLPISRGKRKLQFVIKAN